jgi:hypothetical protein
LINKNIYFVGIFLISILLINTDYVFADVSVSGGANTASQSTGTTVRYSTGPATSATAVTATGACTATPNNIPSQNNGGFTVTCTGPGTCNVGFSIYHAVSARTTPGTLTVTQTGGTGNGSCLLAMAAYGALSPEVEMIHDVRDNKLMKTEFGQDFMSSFDSVYFTFALTVANWQYENPVFKESVRVFITPAITILSLMTLAEEGSEFHAWFLMSTVIALNMGLYIVGPILGIFFLQRHFKK